MTFKDYLAKRRVRNDPQGTFTADALADPQMPNLTEWGQLQRHLLRHGQSHAIEVARLVWAGYRAKLWRDRKRKTEAARTSALSTWVILHVGAIAFCATLY
jgi:hypothetical protein